MPQWCALRLFGGSIATYLLKQLTLLKQVGGPVAKSSSRGSFIIKQLKESKSRLIAVKKSTVKKLSWNSFKSYDIRLHVHCRLKGLEKMSERLEEDCLIFILFVNHLPGKIAVDKCFGYADDLNVLVSNQSDAENALFTIVIWCKINMMHLNVKKCRIISSFNWSVICQTTALCRANSTHIEAALFPSLHVPLRYLTCQKLNYGPWKKYNDPLNSGLWGPSTKED